MTSKAEQHLITARDYVAKGEEFYRKAAEEIVAARNEAATLEECGEMLGKSRKWVTETLNWYLREGEGTPFSEPQGAVAQRHAKAVLRQADDETLSSVIAGLPPERVEAVAKAAHDAQLKNIRGAATASEPALTPSDYETARERIADVRANSGLEMAEVFTALSRLRVAGVERLVANASASERRDWSVRLPDEIALLQLALDLCKTTKLEAVR